MKKRIVILGGCLILFVGVLSTQMGHFQAGLDVKPSDTPKGNYEYYYNEDNSEDTNVAEEGSMPTEEVASEEYIKVDTKPDSYTVLVNREYPISKDYVPEDLVVPKVPCSFYGVYEKSYVRKRAAVALEELFLDAGKEGYTLKLVSAYRSYERQNQIYNNNVNTRGVKKTDKVSAMPGSSEHQTGLAIDVSCNAVGCTIEESFGKTEEGKWLKKNCYKYGFIIRYPKNKTDITGYSYEPWHIRYVGKNLATHLKKNNLTLEEYYKLTTVENAVEEEPILDMDTIIKDEPQMTAAPKPKASIKPTVEPDSTKKPKATKKPKRTKKPKKVKEPSTVEVPKKTQKPVVTKPPKVTAAPVETKVPAATKAPVETKAPDVPASPTDSGDTTEDRE